MFNLTITHTHTSRKAAFSTGMRAKIIFMLTCYLQPIFKITATVIFQVTNGRETAAPGSTVIFFFYVRLLIFWCFC